MHKMDVVAGLLFHQDVGYLKEKRSCYPLQFKLDGCLGVGHSMHRKVEIFLNEIVVP